MVGHSSLFSQLLLLVNRHQFQRRVQECRAEKAAKGFTCWSQFVAMMFCQLAQAKSLREITDGLACCEGKLNHLGLQEGPKRSTLSLAWIANYTPCRGFKTIFSGDPPLSPVAWTAV